MIALPAKNTDEGAEARLLLAECGGPSLRGYSLQSAIQCMQLMDLVLWNRVKRPALFLANHHTLIAVITAPGQFQGFQHYPNYDLRIVHNLQGMINIANNPKKPGAATFRAFIMAAIQIANVPTIPDPSPGTLTAWRTAGSGSPGPNFTLFRTILGTSFFYT
jgi:hypothetical protein